MQTQNRFRILLSHLNYPPVLRPDGSVSIAASEGWRARQDSLDLAREASWLRQIERLRRAA